MEQLISRRESLRVVYDKAVCFRCVYPCVVYHDVIAMALICVFLQFGGPKERLDHDTFLFACSTQGPVILADWVTAGLLSQQISRLPLHQRLRLYLS